MKKIIHILVTPHLAGAQQVSFDILKGLDSTKFDRYILFGGKVKSPSFNKIFEMEGIKVIYLGSLKRNLSFSDITAFWDLFKFFKANDFDIVHTNSTKPGVIARIAAKLGGVKFRCHTVHGIAFHKYESLTKRIIFYFLELFSCMFGSVNVSVNEFYLSYYPRWICRSLTIHNGVDFEALNKKQRVNKNSVVKVGFFARLDKQKDPLTYIHIVNYLIINNLIHKDVHFVIAGDGDLKQGCLDLISELMLQDYISCIGWVSDKSNFFNQLDILCQPSLWEAFGLNIVEAAYFNVPCVASNVEGVPEVIVDGKTGLLCPPKDIIAFSSSLALLINDSNYRKKLGKSAAMYVEERFKLSTMVDSYKKIYSESDSN